MTIKKIYPTIKVIALFIVLLWMSSCSSSTEQQKEIVRPVKAAQVTSLEDMQGRDYPGISQETSEAELSFRVGGPLVQLNVLEGQRIKKGALLAEIDPRDFRVDLLAKEGRYMQTKAEKERYENLYKKQSISKNELDQKTAVYLEAKSAYDAAQNALKDTRMYAPFDAFVGQKFVENHEEVRAKQNILTLIDMSAMEVVTHLPEALAVQSGNFSGFSVEFETFPGVIFAAELKEIEKKPVPEGYPLTLYLKGPLSSDKTYNIVPGFTCKVNIDLLDVEGNMTGKKVIVPLAAVFEGDNDDHPSVWVFDKEKGVVNKRKVVVDKFISDNSVLLSEGVNSGEWVITAGVHRLTEGAQVKELQEKL
jgi:multidrug efflux system membrane fusion protein